jgi:hypothetical protein
VLGYRYSILGVVQPIQENTTSTKRTERVGWGGVYSLFS